VPTFPSLRDVLKQILEFLHLDAGVVTARGIQVVLIWLAAWVAMLVVRRIARRIVRLADDGDDSTFTAREKRSATVAQLLRNVGGVVIFILAALSTLNVFMSIAPILAGAGIIGLAVSFGAQSLVKDIITGFFMLLENQFAVGDSIEAAGRSGVVERMTMRVVQIRDVEGILHTIPNGEISVVGNKTRAWSRAVVDIGVSYDVEADRAIEVFRDEARRFAEDQTWRARLQSAPEVLGVQELAENGMVIRTFVRTIPGLQWDAGREFRRRMKNRLDKEGIDIPYQQRVMHVRLADPRVGEILRGEVEGS
jgi:moderate conductance mechanosensitive channel